MRAVDSSATHERHGWVEAGSCPGGADSFVLTDTAWIALSDSLFGNTITRTLGLFSPFQCSVPFTMSTSQELTERPAPLPPATNEDGEPIKQRTVQQQQKSDNALAQHRRETGQESNRSRSSSRRDRRKRIQQKMRDGEFMHTNSLEALEEADANGELMAMHPFERIGPDSTSMDGPVTHARAMRGEIPVRGSNPNQPYYITPEDKGNEVCARPD